MFCTNCGKEIPDSSQFCEYCGKSTQSKLQSTKNIQVTIQRRKKFTGCAILPPTPADFVPVIEFYELYKIII